MSAVVLADLRAATMELRRIRMALGWEPGDGPPPDPVAVIQMLRGWEVDAQRRAELMEKHLRAVLEVARTWQPDYATKMDRDTLQHAEDFADHKTPNDMLRQNGSDEIYINYFLIIVIGLLLICSI